MNLIIKEIKFIFSIGERRTKTSLGTNGGIGNIVNFGLRLFKRLVV